MYFMSTIFKTLGYIRMIETLIVLQEEDKEKRAGIHLVLTLYLSPSYTLTTPLREDRTIWEWKEHSEC